MRSGNKEDITSMFGILAPLASERFSSSSLRPTGYGRFGEANLKLRYAPIPLMEVMSSLFPLRMGVLKLKYVKNINKLVQN